MHNAYASSMINAVTLRQEPRPLVIGERLNVMGSAASKRCMMQDDINGLVAIARQQVEEEGAHCIDICMANTEGIDEMDLVVRLVKRLSLEVPAPLVIDSTEYDVIREAVKRTPGLPIINSISLEEGRFEENIQTMLTYGCPAIAMCAGKKGVVKTAREKVEIAQDIYGRATSQGIKPEQLIFDPSAFTLCTGDPELRHTAVETLEAIRQIKEIFPKSYTSLGLSNVSFGLKPQARRVLNSVFLYHTIQYGLDAAIINMSRITAYADIPQNERVLAERVIYDKDSDAETDFINYFERQDAKGMATVSADGKSSSDIDAMKDMTAAERCTYKIIHRISADLAGDVQDAILQPLPEKQRRLDNEEGTKDRHESALRVLNDALLPAMKTVGDKFGSGELILPYVLKSAECMKSAVQEMEKYLISDEGTSKGTVVLGTVYGDVHDIGKNLVKTIMQNNGYTVHDLGKQVPIQAFADKIKETDADVVGLSALLVSTSKQMQLFAEHARDQNIKIPIMCGGAAINSSYVNRIATATATAAAPATTNDATSTCYEHGMWYCRDMFDGLKVIDGLVTDKQALIEDYAAKIHAWQKNEEKKNAGAQSASVKQEQKQQQKKTTVPLLDSVRYPQFRKLADVRHMRNIPFVERGIWNMIDKKSLFKLSWGVRGRAATKDTTAEFERLFVDWQHKISDSGWFDQAYAAYGFFRCRSSGDTLQVYDENGSAVEFEFPRSGRESNLCLADYFNSDRDDVVALQVVTVGSKVADVIEQYNKSDQYTDAYYLHGMAVEAAEGLAEYCNRQICHDLQLPRALRYSWGYPSCPDTEQHRQVWQLLKPDRHLQLTSAGQITPEFSTAAIVVQHPEAKYFVP